jgi:arylsulfatase A-like enzyme
VREEHSETAYITDRALEWIRAQGERPWLLHLSYVKPHWPYVAPAPWHALYRGGDVGPVRRGAQDGTGDEHPVVSAYREHDECKSFAREDVARHVRPAYMGLTAQIDHHLGRVLKMLDESGRLDDTLILFTSDHGDFLGDRGLGEKELFYDEIVRIPFLLYDPSPQADATRGQAELRFVQGIDVVPTILDALRIPLPSHRVEGRSLLPLTRGSGPADWRDATFSELDYSYRRARHVLGRGVDECRAWMVRTSRWKYVHWLGMRPQLFDLEADPAESRDLGARSGHDVAIAEMRSRLFDWLSNAKRRTTVSAREVDDRTDAHRRHGVHIGIW